MVQKRTSCISPTIASKSFGRPSLHNCLPIGLRALMPPFLIGCSQGHVTELIWPNEEGISGSASPTPTGSIMASLVLPAA